MVENLTTFNDGLIKFTTTFGTSKAVNETVKLIITEVSNTTVITTVIKKLLKLKSSFSEVIFDVSK